MTAAIIERIKKGQFFEFHGGIHPPEQKFLTNNKAIATIEPPKELIIPLQQHIGSAGEPLVKVGDTVLKGQALTVQTNPMSVPVHAPTSGTITAIKPSIIAHPSGFSEPCLFLEPDGNDTWVEREYCEDFTRLTRAEIIQKIVKSGISGMGGAGFPTHIKVDTKPGIRFLIINAVECEPYITADDLLMREHVATLVKGIEILQHLLLPENILIGIEDNKPEAIECLKRATENYDNIHVCVIPTIYPSGGEKQLIKILTGEEVNHGELPIKLGMVMQNIATVYAIAEAVIEDKPLIRRVVTVTGKALSKPRNVWALIGTPVGYLLEQCGYQADSKHRLIMGGPMMGFTLPSLNVPVVKITNCVIAPSVEEISIEQNERECIRCGECAEVCPSQLLPQELQWSAKANDYDQLMALNLFDCIDCGACAYVCPSQIPLVHYYRVAKAGIREQRLQQIKAEKAKQRFEVRKRRLEREKLEREEKHRKAAEARKKAMSANTDEAKSAKSAVEAALARVNAKKKSAEDTASNESKSPAKNAAAAAIARAKAKKAAKAQAAEQVPEQASEQTSEQTSEQEVKRNGQTPQPETHAQEEVKDTVKDPVKKAAAAAIARAKAKKAAQANTAGEAPAQASTESSETEEKLTPAKRAAQAAIARAKAKKAAQQAASESEVTEKAETKQEVAGVAEEASEEKLTPAKRAAKAAIAKAKAKKEESAEDSNAGEVVKDEAVTAEKAAKSKVADAKEESSEEKLTPAKRAAKAAIAKAKAKKEAQAKKSDIADAIKKAQAEPVNDDNETSELEAKASQVDAKAQSDDNRKEKIQQAIAKADAQLNESAEEQKREQAQKSADLDESEKLKLAKKERIAQAIAKAKLKKQQRTNKELD